jgi:tRNA U34 5-methylaminomethyl-2-thiouridine-forming methyltransferase MnmC
MENGSHFAHNDLRAFQATADGSHTLFSSRFQETYHSRHGARTESEHVFIRHGLDETFQIFEGPIRIFEVGVGTGLNAYLAAIRANEVGREVWYNGFEEFPLNESQRASWLAFEWDQPEVARQIGLTPAGQSVSIGAYFHFSWQCANWPGQSPDHECAEVIFYDAFAPGSQPELWTAKCFQKAFNLLAPGGILVTYCAKGEVKRNMKEVGFEVQRLQGPPGKREMTRAIKPR